MWDFIKIVFGGLGLFLALCVGWVALGMWVSPWVEVYVDQEKVYKGPRFCVEVESAGNATYVKTFCNQIGTYLSSDVVVKNVEKNYE